MSQLPRVHPEVFLASCGMWDALPYSDVKADSDPEVLSNYWPISLLLFLSKVLEKLVAKQVTTHFQKGITRQLFSH